MQNEGGGKKELSFDSSPQMPIAVRVDQAKAKSQEPLVCQPQGWQDHEHLSPAAIPTHTLSGSWTGSFESHTLTWTQQLQPPHHAHTMNRFF